MGMPFEYMVVRVGDAIGSNTIGMLVLAHPQMMEAIKNMLSSFM
jgi:hypothetical protein